MSTDQSQTEDRSLEDAANPLQFRLLELFGLMTVVALVCAMAAPLLNGFDTGFQKLLVATVTCQIAFAMWVAYQEGKKRQALFDKMGKRLGVGLCSQLTWKYWPLIWAILESVLLLSYQIVLAVHFSREFVTGAFEYSSFIGLLYFMQLAWFTGKRFSQYRNHVYPNSVEFFTNGICRAGNLPLDWKWVEVRESNLFPDRITLVIRQTPESVGATTLVVQVSDNLRGKIFSASCL